MLPISLNKVIGLCKLLLYHIALNYKQSTKRKYTIIYAFIWLFNYMRKNAHKTMLYML